MNDKLQDNIFEHQSGDSEDPKSENKKKIIAFAKELVFEDIEMITNALEEQAALIEKRSVLQTTKHQMEDKERLEKTREIKGIEYDMVTEEEWKKASEAVPIEFHVELIQQAYDTD